MTRSYNSIAKSFNFPFAISDEQEYNLLLNVYDDIDFKYRECLGENLPEFVNEEDVKNIEQMIADVLDTTVEELSTVKYNDHRDTSVSTALNDLARTYYCNVVRWLRENYIKAYGTDRLYA